LIPKKSDYFQVISKKTAALFSTACLTGALLGNPHLAEKMRKKVKAVGVLVGIAYQMVDDLLDVWGNKKLGKPRWKDWENGWVTLPFIMLLESCSLLEAQKIKELLHGGEIGADGKAYLFDLLGKYMIETKFRGLIETKITLTKDLLEKILEDSKINAIEASLDFILNRVH
jgi:geranylgeranyl pyrophosphate synthase